MTDTGEPGGVGVGGGLAQRLGIFARTFRRDTPEEVAAAIAEAGYPFAHWNFAAIGRSTLATDVDEAHVTAFRRAFDAVGVRIPSVSATYKHRRQRVDRPPAHPGRAVWKLRDAGVRLGVEPEPGNVICNARVAAALLDELGEDAPIGILLDPANLLSPETIPRHAEILTEAVDLLGPRVIGVQAKDVVVSGYSAPGAGLLDYAAFTVLARLQPVPLIVQDADETDARRVRADLLRWSGQASAATGFVTREAVPRTDKGPGS